MKYFDLHCDTLYRALIEKKSIINNDFHISLERGEKLKPWFQCFAVWIPDNLRGKPAFEFVQKAHSFLIEELKNYDDKMMLCKDKTDYISVYQNKKTGAVFTLEGSAGLGGNVDNLYLFKKLGVQIITLTWNGNCEFGSGIMAEKDSGITEFGKKALKIMEELKIIPDVSHSSDKLFYDVANLSKNKIIATHSNSRSICSNKRNLTDEQFKVIKDKNGLVGLNFCNKFLNNEKQKASIENILRHAEHFMSLGGENTVCMGGDFDGTDVPKDIKGIQSVYDIAECFLKHNYSEKLVNKFLFYNAYNFFVNL